MKPTTDPTEWTQHLRSINEAFELRETALLAELEKVTKQRDKSSLRNDELAALPQTQLERLDQSAQDPVKSKLKQRESERGHFRAELEARLAEQRVHFEAQLRDARAELHDGLRQAQQKEIEFKEILMRVKDTARTELEAKLQEQLVREQNVSAQLLALCQQYDLSRTNLSASHHEQLMAIEASLREHYRSWRSLADALEAQLRDRLDAERTLRSQVQGVLNSVQNELSEVRSSFLYRAARFWRRTNDFTDRIAPTRPLENSEIASGQLVSTDISLLHEDASLTKSGFANHMSGLGLQQPPDSAQTARSIDELLNLCDIPFVNCAYRTILGRAPDPNGLKNYLDQVRKGVSKRQIVAELTQSDEGRNRTLDLPGLTELLNIHNSRDRWWLWRRNVSRSQQALEMQLCSMENRIGFVANERAKSDRSFEMQLQNIENRIEFIANSLEAQLQNIREHIDKLNTNLSDVRTLLAQHQADDEWEMAVLRTEIRALSTTTPSIRDRIAQKATGPRGDRDPSPSMRTSKLMSNVCQEAGRMRAKSSDARPADEE